MHTHQAHAVQLQFKLSCHPASQKVGSLDEILGTACKTVPIQTHPSHASTRGQKKSAALAIFLGLLPLGPSALVRDPGPLVLDVATVLVGEGESEIPA